MAAPPQSLTLKTASRPCSPHEQFNEEHLTQAFETLNAAMAGLDAVVRKKLDEASVEGAGQRPSSEFRRLSLLAFAVSLPARQSLVSRQSFPT